jgi:hypothetical protein
MRFLTIYRAVETNAPPTPEEMANMGQLIEEMKSAGTLVSAEGCQPSSQGARVRRTKGKVTVSDGPFTESKEVIGGFAILEAKSLDEAKELTRRFLAVVGDGESEIRLLHDAPAA